MSKWIAYTTFLKVVVLCSKWSTQRHLPHSLSLSLSISLSHTIRTKVGGIGRELSSVFILVIVWQILFPLGNG